MSYVLLNLHFADFFAAIHDLEVPMVQLIPSYRRSVFRILHMSQQLQGLGDAVALTVSNQEYKNGTGKDLVELGGKAMESYLHPHAFVFCSTPEDSLGFIGELLVSDLTPGYAIHMQVKPNRVRVRPSLCVLLMHGRNVSVLFSFSF